MNPVPSFSEDWQALVLCPNREMAAELLGLLAGCAPRLRTAEWDAYPAPEELVRLLRSLPLDICFLDVETNTARALELLQQSPSITSRVPVITLLGRNDPNLILRTVRLGASGFLLRPFTADQLAPAFERARQFLAARQPPAERLGRVWCVLPAKGASGATTVAINLAWHVSRLGYGKVLLADLDPLTSPVSFLLKIKSPYSFVDALTNVAHLDNDLWKALVVHFQGFDVLLGPENPADTTTESHGPAEMLEHARGRYDLVLVDVGAPFSKWSLDLAERSDELLVVASGEPAALYGARRVVAYLQRAGIAAAQVRLILNRQRRGVGLDPEGAAKVVGLPVYHVIPEDTAALARAQMNGRPAPSDSAIGRSLAELASRLLGQSAAALPKASLWRAWFGRLGGNG
jgi:pilus assembly protein CpaE